VRVLLADDEVALAETVRRGLERDGSVVEVVHNGEDAVWAASESAFDVLVLDIMMPKGNGYQVIRELRRRGIWTPVLMLTAIDQDDRLATALDAGADDYLTKPFALEELLARVRALGRRAGDGAEDQLVVGELVLDLARHEARRDDQSIELTAKEFDLLAYLMRNTGRVLSKDQITEHVWGYDSQATSNVVEIYIHYLRDKIDRGFPRPLIRTVRGVGYTIKA